MLSFVRDCIIGLWNLCWQVVESLLLVRVGDDSKALHHSYQHHHSYERHLSRETREIIKPLTEEDRERVRREILTSVFRGASTESMVMPKSTYHDLDKDLDPNKESE